MTLTKRDRLELRNLLNKLQAHTESAIESCCTNLVLDEGPERQREILSGPVGAKYVGVVARDRKDWRKTEDWLIRLERGT